MLSISILLASTLSCGSSEEAATADSLADLERSGAVIGEGPVAIQQWNDDSLLVEAASALRQGRPWHATEILAPIVRDSTRRTQRALLLAATAAAGWKGWREVRALLDGEPWIDTAQNGLARELLARAALGASDDSVAVTHAALAVASAATDSSRGVRLTLLGRALDRIDALDSARVAYEAATHLLPTAGDWLRLRAAGVVADSAARALIYGQLTLATARRRIASTEALARERTGDLPGAIAAFGAIGSRLSALRLRAALAADSAARDSVRRELVATLANARGSDPRVAAGLLDSLFSPLAPEEELVVGRALDGLIAGRAEQAYRRAFAAGLGTGSDRFQHASLLFRLGRHREAAAGFARIRPPERLSGIAAYQRARSLLYAGDLSAAREGLRTLLRTHPSDSSAALAYYLLADLATDEHRDTAARDAWRDLARRFPRHWRAPTAAFRAAMIAYTGGDRATAARELDSLVARYPSTSETPAARYWSGRAWALLGDSVKAHQRWRETVTRDPLTYYGAAAARRLGEGPWAPAAAADSFARIDSVDAAFARADLLRELGMDVEADFEFDRITADASESIERLLTTAAAFRDRGATARAIPLAQQAVGRGAPRDARAYRLIYPVVLRDVLVEESRATGLDPSLVAALIRQESRFVPGATSPVGARGLMQVMPDVGRDLARSLGFPVWDPVLLYQPDVNAKLGTRHLADLFRRYDEIVHILSAYNAGVSRVERWVTKQGVEDPEVFIERIPYVETRDYVRIVLRNRDLYRALYGW